MNLLEEPWIPVRRASGLRERIAPHEITDRLEIDPVVALDAPRPDFNGALIQFLIGLVQTAWVLADKDWDRDEMLWSPPPPQGLAEVFEPLKEAFGLDSVGPRFMQDLTLGPTDSPAENEVSALLIDFPGAQSIEKNADHFVKRDRGGVLCAQCAATALFCLMTNAPGGGAGHRTSVRGGGPLTTLIAYTQTDQSQPRPALWRDVAGNIVEAAAFNSPRQDKELPLIFPWLRSVNHTSSANGTVQPLDVHPLQVYWAMPRRIRLQFVSDAASPCAICNCVGVVSVPRYITKNYGLNYKGPWRHPLSPYYRSKGSDAFLPVHPQPDGMTYRHWLGWTLGSKRGGTEIVQADVVRAFHSSRVLPGQLRLWAFGYDMDNMKARCWYETTFPLFDISAGVGLSAETLEIVVAVVDQMISTAESIGGFLRFAVRDAWVSDGEARGDLGYVEAALWNRTEREFFAGVEQVIAMCRESGRAAFDQSESLRREWLDTLRRATLKIFDEVAARGNVEAGNPARLAAAHRSLRSRLYGRGLLAGIGLNAADTTVTPASRPATARKSARASLEAK